MRVTAEYIWTDGASPTAQLRSKTKVVDLVPRGSEGRVSISDFPEWGFDGSSTYQAEGHDSDCILRPVAIYPDPIREMGVLVMCEVFNPDGSPHCTNTRAELRRVLDQGADASQPWFGIEQEYTLTKDNQFLGFIAGCETPYRGGQGPYYCSVGADVAFGRELIEAHMEACLKAGLHFEGINGEVMPGQWEFQIGTADPLTVGDDLWVARWLLHRLGEDYGYTVLLDAKPKKGDWNGAGAHTNFSTEDMRLPAGSGVDANGSPTRTGIDAIYDACEKLRTKTAEHIAVYGAGIEDRLTGKHETCSYKEFKYGIANRGCSIRIPRHVATKGYGYLEDRRPCANMDPYAVCARILKTVCGVE